MAAIVNCIVFAFCFSSVTYFRVLRRNWSDLFSASQNLLDNRGNTGKTKSDFNEIDILEHTENSHFMKFP